MPVSKSIWLLLTLLFLLSWSASANEVPVHECDRLAAHPADSNKVTPGVSWAQLNPELALPACEDAVGEHPEVARFVFQYARVLHKAEDIEKAVSLYRSLAEKGYVQAQLSLGGMYYRGLGVPQDYAEAVKWSRKAAEQGHAGAQLRLGYMYENGLGVPQDDIEAIKWYRKAAEQGQAFAQNNLGVMYDKGLGVPQDYAEAAKWYRKAAEQGQAFAQYNLGVMYHTARGMPQDETKAVKWYRMAAEQGNPDAQHELGRMYWGGRGVPSDKVQAYMWVSLAAARGHKSSKGRVDQLAAEMTSAQIAEAQKIAWEWEKKHAGPLRAIDFEPESGFVVIDQSHSAYTVFTGIPKESSEQELDEIKSKISKKEKLLIVTWAEFIKNAHKYANSRIVKHEYMKYGVIEGIVCLVGKAPGAPWGLTWNGGIALTWNDYRHAREAYQLYQKVPEKYEQTANRDPRADPINPGGHLPAFGCG